MSAKARRIRLIPKWRGNDREIYTEEWLDLAVKSASLGAWNTGIETGFQDIQYTEKYSELWDLADQEEWTREEWLKRVHPRDRDSVKKQMDSAVAGETDDYSVEYRCFMKDGRICWHKAWGKVIRDEQGRVNRVTGVLTDITDQKKLEVDRGQFVAALTHDIRNPLAAARANVELVEHFPEKIHDRNSLLDRVVISIDRVDRIVQDLLDASRMRAGESIPILISEGDLKDLIEDTLRDFKVQYGDRFRLNVSGDFRGRWFLTGIRRAVENLIVNAIKYGSPDKPVTISLSRRDGLISISVHNEGTPIPPEDQKHLFESFKRARNTEGNSTEGWGLGLTVVNAVAVALNGNVTVQSDPGSGTTFRVQFSTH